MSDPAGGSLRATLDARGLPERLLVDVIGLEWEKAHREADRWEHAISADVEEKLILLLGDPATCPHGNPIPGSGRTAAHGPTTPLTGATPGPVDVVRIGERIEVDDDALTLLSSAALIPGRRAEVVEVSPAGVRVRTESGDHLVPTAIADLTYVSG